MTNGIQLILAERIRQAKKYDATHDDRHDDGSLAHLGAYLAGPDDMVVNLPVWASITGDAIIDEHGADPLKQLIIGGALVAAEIDRRLRIMGEITYAPPAKWAECATDAQRAEHVAGQASDYRVWQDEVNDADSGPAFDFAGEAAQFYLPWCVARIQELEAKVAEAEPPGRIMTVAFTQEGDEINVVTQFHESVPVADTFSLIGQGISGMVTVARTIGKAHGMSEEEVDALIFGQRAEVISADAEGESTKEGVKP